MINLVSVIVPVYNVEKYLPQCVNSILEQTYRDIEVILVDDGSQDSSPQICDEYALQDRRVKIVHQKNGGLSDARNAGVAVAIGEYVIFMDSDDYWYNSEVLASLIKIFENSDDDIDFINFNCQYFYQRDNLLKPWPNYPVTVVKGNTKKEIILALIRHGIFPMSACMKLIKRKFLEENNIRFVEDITSEDIPWFLELLLKSNNCRFVNEFAYIYRKQVDGTISSSFSEKKFNDLFLIVSQETKKIQMSYSDVDLKGALLSFMAYEYCILLGMVNNFGRTKQRKHVKRLRQFHWLFQYDLNPKVKKVKMLLQLVGIYFTRIVLFWYIKKVVNRV